MSEQKSSKKLYSSGEFARLSGINKSTLFYYDRIGLLQPAMVDENGYRYYTSEQLFGPYIIAFLQSIGKSLDYIRFYLDNRVPGYFVSITGDIINDLEEQKRQLQNRINIVKAQARIIERAGEDLPGVPSIYDDEDEYQLIVTPLGNNKPTFGENYSDAFLAHHNFCVNELHTVQYPLGYIADIGYMHTRTRGRGTWIATLLSDDLLDVPPERLVTRPAGRYVRMLHNGPYEHIGQSCRKLLAYMDRSNLIPASRIYVLEINTFLTGSDTNDFTFNLSVKIQ